jgi:hypothetical protein
MATSATNADDRLGPRPQAAYQRAAEVLLIVIVFFSIAGDPPPDVNEAHYLARLKHYWNPEWCAGDLFLESQDAQPLLVWAFGWVTKWLSLTATAWLGRVMAWTLLALAWQRLSWLLAPRPLAAVLSAALFVTLNERAHLAGEWVVGGVEAKCFAYGFVLWALGDLVLRRWNRMWLLLGAATAFHPIVGGWSAVACGGIWFWENRGLRALRSSSPGLFGFALLGSVGVVPALMLTWNEPAELVAEASRIYVFERLPHHLALTTLPQDEFMMRILRHAALLAALGGLIGAQRTTVAAGSASDGVKEAAGSVTAPAEPVARISYLAWFALGAVLLALSGFAIELALQDQPVVAARLLRYYWFRLTDFAAPMAAALYFTALVAAGLGQRRAWAVWLLAAGVVAACWHITSIAGQRALRPLPPADAKIPDFAAWVEVCDWVAEHTPHDAMFLTPRLNHTFKWRAGRPEIANRKDIPQDARSIVAWHRRIKDIYYSQRAGLEQSHDSIGVLGTERVRELANKYSADYVLMDRGQLLALPRVYWNEEYVVYRIDERSAADRE